MPAHKFIDERFCDSKQRKVSNSHDRGFSGSFWRQNEKDNRKNVR